MSMKQTIKRVMDAHGLTGTPGLVEYTCELLAELSKDEPVGYRYVDHNGHWCFNEMKFGDIAEPVYSHHAPVSASEQKPVAWVDVIDRHEGPYNFNGLELLDSGKHLLFTSPPNTADIEQRVAEAIALSVQALNNTRYNNECDRSVVWECAIAIRSGKWREYL